MINNTNAHNAILDCEADLFRITTMIGKIGSTDKISGYLTQYSLIRICGTLEISYKTIIADFYENEAPTLGHFIGFHLREASMNPTYENICQAIVRFDENKNKIFKQLVNNLKDCERLKESFSVLNRSRNEVAHGNMTTLSFNDMKSRFSDAVKIIEVLDSIMV